jgi:hypothetical protein
VGIIGLTKATSKVSMGDTFGSKMVNNPQEKNLALKLKKRARKKKSKGRQHQTAYGDEKFSTALRGAPKSEIFLK